MRTSNLRKAAILLTSIPTEEASRLLSNLDQSQIEMVTIEIAKLGTVTGDEQESTIQDFANSSPNDLDARAGGLAVAKNLLESALGDRAGATIENIRNSIESLPFGFLQGADSQNLLTFLIEEHPQTIALILSHTPPALSAAVIAGLPPDRQISVIRRIATMGQTSPEMVHEVEIELQRRMSSTMDQIFENADGVGAVAKILNVTERATERALLDDLSQDDPDLVEEIRRLMFVFEDVAKLSNRDIQSILKNVESSDWAMALKGCSEELRSRIIGNMSKRAAELLTEEMEYLGAVRLSSVEQVQQKIVDVVRQLEDAGEVSLHADEEEEQFIQ